MITTLPTDCLNIIFSYCAHKTYHAMQHTCKQLYQQAIISLSHNPSVYQSCIRWLITAAPTKQFTHYLDSIPSFIASKEPLYLSPKVSQKKYQSLYEKLPLLFHNVLLSCQEDETIPDWLIPCLENTQELVYIGSRLLRKEAKKFDNRLITSQLKTLSVDGALWELDTIVLPRLEKLSLSFVNIFSTGNEIIRPIENITITKTVKMPLALCQKFMKAAEKSLTLLPEMPIPKDQELFSSSLQELQVSTLSQRGIENLFSKQSHLTSFSLFQEDFVSDTYIGTTFPKTLQKIDLLHPNITSASFASLITSCSKLQELSFRTLKNITLDSNAHLPELRTLCISYEIFRHTHYDLQTMFPKLEQLTFVAYNQRVDLFNRFTIPKQIKILQLEAITVVPATLTAILLRCPELEEISCTITGDLETPAQQLSHIRKVTIYASPIKQSSIFSFLNQLLNIESATLPAHLLEESSEKYTLPTTLTELTLTPFQKKVEKFSTILKESRLKKISLQFSTIFPEKLSSIQFPSTLEFLSISYGSIAVPLDKIKKIFTNCQKLQEIKFSMGISGTDQLKSCLIPKTVKRIRLRACNDPQAWIDMIRSQVPEAIIEFY
jgi:hypothetical protein